MPRCSNCHFDLANHDERAGTPGRCDNCAATVCFVCGCTEAAACIVTKTTRDRSNSETYTCGWSGQPGTCSFCWSRIAYEFYQEATGQPADDAFFMSLGREPWAYKGLAYGV